MLLFTEPFTPGDMVCFTTRGTSYEGKVSQKLVHDTVPTAHLAHRKHCK